MTKPKLSHNFLVLYFKNLLAFTNQEYESIESVKAAIEMDSYIVCPGFNWEGAAIHALEAMDNYITTCRKYGLYTKNDDIHTPNPYINDGKYLDFVMRIKNAMAIQSVFAFNTSEQENVWKTMFGQIRGLFCNNMLIDEFDIEYPEYSKNIHIRWHEDLSSEESLSYCKQICEAHK